MRRLALALLALPLGASPAAAQLAVTGALSTQSQEQAAVLAGTGYTLSTSVQTVAIGSYLSLLMTNPAGSGKKILFTVRNITCDNPTGSVASKYYALTVMPTTNVPSTVVTPANRLSGGPASVITAAYSSGALPDTSPSVPVVSRLGGMISTGGTQSGPQAIPRALIPGQVYMLSAMGVSNGGLSAAPTCSIDVAYIEMPYP